MRVMAKMADLITFFVHAIACRRTPGELERQEHDKKEDQVSAHGRSLQRTYFSSLHLGALPHKLWVKATVMQVDKVRLLVVVAMVNTALTFTDAEQSPQ